MPIPGTVPLSGTVAPTSELDTFPVTNPKYGLGGLRTVANTTERNDIPTERRQVGMIVYVMDLNAYYGLAGGTGNNNWVPLPIPDVRFLSSNPVEDDILAYDPTLQVYRNIRKEVITDGGTY
jgi:hypothetical protein